MEATVRFKVIKDNGRKASIKVKYTDCPDFIEEKIIANFAKHPTKEGYLQVTFGNQEVINGETEQAEIIKDIAEQIDEWVETFDKSLWMDNNDVAIILTWEVLSYSGMVKNVETGETGLATIQTKSGELAKQEKLSAIDHMKLFFDRNKDDISQEVIDNYIVIYAEMGDQIKHMAWQKQMEIVFKTMEIASTAASKALDDISSYGKALEQVDWKKHKYTKATDINKYGTWNMNSIHREAKMIQNGHQMDNNLILPQNTESNE